MSPTSKRRHLRLDAWSNLAAKNFRRIGSDLPARRVLIAAGLLFALVFGLRVLDDRLATGVGLLYTLPIALLAVRFGLRGGLAAAALATLLYGGWAVAADLDLPIVAFVGRPLMFFLLGGLVGYFSELAAANQERLEIALKNAPITVFNTDADMRFTWIHRSWRGPVEDPPIGRTAADILKGAGGERVQAIMRGALKSGAPANGEVVINHRDGSQHWYWLEAEPIRNASQQIVGLSGAALDITAERAASAALAESERRFRTAAENMLEPFALYSAIRGANGAITDFRAEFVNGPAAASVGMRSAEMVGKNLTELFPGRLESGLLNEYAKVVETGEPLFREAIDYINVLGEHTLVRAFDVRVSKLDDGIEITWRDITDRARAEKTRDWTLSIVESAADSIMSIDTEGKVVTWSTGAEQLHGYSADEAIGRPITFLFEDQHRAEREVLMRRVLAGETVGPVTALERHKDGSEIYLTFTAAPIFDENGEVIGATRVARSESEPQGGDGRASVIKTT